MAAKEKPKAKAKAKTKSKTKAVNTKALPPVGSAARKDFILS